MRYSLSSEQSDTAGIIALHAEKFVFAHEVSHILISEASRQNGTIQAKENELAADREALALVLGKHTGAFPSGVRYVYAGAVLAVRVYAGLGRLGYRFRGTHPPPAKRLSALREHAAHLLGGRTGYLSTGTLAFSIDRVLEAAERRLAGFDPSERKDQILANTNRSHHRVR